MAALFVAGVSMWLGRPREPHKKGHEAELDELHKESHRLNSYQAEFLSLLRSCAYHLLKLFPFFQ